MKKLDNRGFSLVELLVAVLVLAIITVPLLQLYVMSAQTTAKSRRTGDVTIAAQNLVEVIQARSVGQVLSQTPPHFSDVAALFGSASAAVAVDAASGIGTVELEGVSSGNRTFDATITLDPRAYRAANAINDKDITQYTAMDGVYYQKNGEMDVDALAEDLFNQDHADTEVTTRHRTISIDITKADKKVYAKVKFVYTFGYRWTEAVGETTVERHSTTVISMVETELFPDGYPALGEPFSVYLFFKPYYAGNTGAYQDYITINNADHQKCSVFLVKQDTNATIAQENAYGAKVELKENHAADRTQFYTTIFSNIAKRLETAGDISNISYRKYYGSVYYELGSFGDGALIDKKKEDRLYDVTVEMYERGRSDLLLTFRASKLQ